MVRTAVLTCLMISHLADPLFCCCTATRFNALLSTAPKGSTSSTTCCARHGPLEAGRHVRANEPEKPPLQDRSGCPCREDPSHPIFALLSGAEVVRHSPERVLSHDTFGLSLSVTFQQRASFDLTSICPGARYRLPFLSAYDLLRVFHLLRC